MLIALVFYACLFSHLGVLGLVGPDEPRYAAVAREMAERGDWVTPRLYSQPWFEKPILYYWAAATAFRAFGVSEFAARLPSAISAALAAIALAWAGRRFCGPATGWAALLIVPTSIGVFGFARAATPDMLFSAALAGAMVAASYLIWGAASRVPGDSAAQAALGACLGVAALAKGPAAIVLAAGSSGLWALATGRWRDAFRLMSPVAMVVFSVVALPWYVLCATRNREFVHTFLFTHNLERYLTPVFQHEQPFWFFGPVILIGLLPWTALLAGVTWNRARIRQLRDGGNRPGVFFACWAICPILFFSFSRAKLPGYALPAVLAFDLLLARVAGLLLEERNGFGRWMLATIGATFPALAASANHLLKRLPPEASLGQAQRLSGWILMAAAGGILLASLGLLGRRWPALLAAAVLTAGMVEAVNRQALPQLDTYLSARTAAQAAQALPGPTDNVFVYNVRRAWRNGLNFYFHQELPDWTPQIGRPARVFTDATGVAELERQGYVVRFLERGSPQALLVEVEGHEAGTAAGPSGASRPKAVGSGGRN
ncbi:MAG TPA: glycosyltransferase family 39 protein [Candidatus Acidoferrales bacterium]|nr:glycosyltransferase family 39 protein [Candidatus Acidoferrales bacterium]